MPHSLDSTVKRIVRRHPDQVALYASGKACVGFLVTRVVLASKAPIREAHVAVVNELESRVKLGPVA